MSDSPDRQRSRARRDRLALIGASMAAGLAALVFIFVGTRSMTLREFAPVSQLWTLWAISYAVVTFSTQQSMIRTKHSRSRFRWTTVLLPTVVTALAFTAVMVTQRERLFASESLWWPVAGAIIPFGSLLTGLARGKLAAEGETGRLAAVVAGENGVRALLAGALALVGADPIWFGYAILAGFLVAAVGFIGGPEGLPGGATVTSRRDTRLVFAASVAGLSSHVVLVLAPALLALGDASAASVSAIFILLALYRAPYQLVLGLGPSVSNDMVRRAPDLTASQVRAQSNRFVVVAVAAALLLSFPIGLVGDKLLSPLFGLEGLLEPIDHSLATALTILAIASIVLTMALYALSAATPLLVLWPTLAFVGMSIVLLTREDTTFTLATLLAVEATILLSLWMSVRRVAGRTRT